MRAVDIDRTNSGELKCRHSLRAFPRSGDGRRLGSGSPPALRSPVLGFKCTRKRVRPGWPSDSRAGGDPRASGHSSCWDRLLAGIRCPNMEVSLPKPNARAFTLVDEEQRLLTVQEAAHALGVSQQYVRRLLRGGRLRGLRLGRAWAIAGRDIRGIAAARLAVPLFRGQRSGRQR
jgi:excisionase family DNA binding protein